MFPVKAPSRPSGAGSNFLHTLRITRILDSLSTLGLAGHARAFLRALEGLDERERRAIGPETYRYWREATR